MVFNAIAFWLLVAAVPLWIYRWFAYSRLSAAEKQLFKRLVARRHERSIGFALRIFGFLTAFTAAVFVVVFGLRYLKYGTFHIPLYRDMFHTRLYSDVEPVDQALDTLQYDQVLPIAILTTCLLLSIAFTLVAAALRDINLIRRLHRKFSHLGHMSGTPAS
ncbi:hypothetical protein [Labrenzia sp. 011]|uniref:hypothetical protein n=1 Tax=Labrenzia sp. 011 TaxID=2171494 RepID=UPI000D5193AF|nr:hypothetical protein [Labrenzia sp. 011]PVB59783.1 hypothetical protein DCO57_20515 [Labrenzia sp. 011]